MMGHVILTIRDLRHTYALLDQLACSQLHMKMYIRNQIYFYLYTRWRHDLVVTFADI